LLTGPLERTNRPYAIAKISGVEMCWAYNRQYGTRYLAVMPTNLYGPGDSYNLENSHVLPALIRKMHLARLATLSDFQGIGQDEMRYGAIPEDIRHSLFQSSLSGGAATTKTVTVKIWGTGTPRREFLHSDDMAAACVHLMRTQDKLFDSAFVRESEPPLVNIGCGQDISIRELAEIVKDVVGFEGEFEFDTTKPDGTPRKLLDVSRLFRLGWRPRISFRDGIMSVYKQYS
jgi:GDP-L-fucose synthase